MIILKDIIKQYKNKPALYNVNLHIRPGEFVFLTGPSGAGKSTLMKMLYMEEKPTRGQILVGGINIANLNPNKIPNLRRCMGIVFQDFQLLMDRNVYYNLDFVLRATGMKKKKERQKRINEVLEQVGLLDKSQQMPFELSGGEQQRICIARAILNHPKVILADEATGNLDKENSRKAAQLLHEISKDGTTVIMSTHNESLITEFPGIVYRCANGLVEECTDEFCTPNDKLVIQTEKIEENS